jgi:selenocysteine lyase/cysteine desulfurase
VARLLGVDADGLAFVLNASAGASVIYGSLLSRGPVDVMTTDHGYGAVTMGAQRLAARTGGRATRVDVPLAATSTEVLRLLTEALERERPQLLVIDQVTSATARAFPAEEICRLAGSLGVLTLVDGAHVPGAVAAPVSSADYWVGNLHKFACAPRGAAVLVVRELGAFVDDPLPDVGQPVGWMRLLRLPEPLGRTRQAADALRVPFTAEAGIVAAFTSFKDEGYRRLSAHAYSSPDDFAEVATVGVRLLDEWSRERPGATSSG